MPIFHKVTEGLFIVLMAAGAMFALYALNAAVEDYLDAVAIYGGGALAARGWHIGEVGGTAILELAMTAAFAIVYVRRGSNLLAPLTYAWCYAILGLSFAALLLAIGKSSKPQEYLWVAPVYLLLALVITLPSLVWNYRRSTKS